MGKLGRSWGPAGRGAAGATVAEAPPGAAGRPGRNSPRGAAYPFLRPRRAHLPLPHSFSSPFSLLSPLLQCFIFPSPIAYLFFSLLTGYVRARIQTLSLGGLTTVLVTKELTLTRPRVVGEEDGSPGCPAVFCLRTFALSMASTCHSVPVTTQLGLLLILWVSPQMSPPWRGPP